MGILANLTDEIKTAMRAKDSLRLEALRAIKSAVMLEQTSSAAGTILTDEQEIKLVQKLVKQRKDRAQIFKDQNRPDLEICALSLRCLTSFCTSNAKTAHRFLKTKTVLI